MALIAMEGWELGRDQVANEFYPTTFGLNTGPGGRGAWSKGFGDGSESVYFSRFVNEFFAGIGIVGAPNSQQDYLLFTGSGITISLGSTLIGGLNYYVVKKGGVIVITTDVIASQYSGWKYFEFHIKSGSNGELEIRIDQESKGIYNGSVGADGDAFNRIVTSGDLLTVRNFDDFIAFDTVYDAPDNDTWPGPTQISSIGVTGNGDTNDFTQYPVLNNCSGSPYATEILNDSPKGYWKLDEGGGGIAVDSSGNGHNGTINGSSSVPGIFGVDDLTNTTYDNGALNLSFSVSTHADFNPSTNLTLEAWVFWDPGGADSPTKTSIFKKTGQYDLRLRAPIGYDSRFGIEFDVTTTTTVTAATSTFDFLSVCQWHHIVGVYDGANIYIYADSVLVATQPQTGSIASTANSLTSTIVGSFDELALYSTALSQARIQTHYCAGSHNFQNVYRDDHQYSLGYANIGTTHDAKYLYTDTVNNKELYKFSYPDVLSKIDALKFFIVVKNGTGTPVNFSIVQKRSSDMAYSPTTTLEENSWIQQNFVTAIDLIDGQNLNIDNIYNSQFGIRIV